MKLWKVYISGTQWQGGDYNGTWGGFTNIKLFSTKEKAKRWIKEYKQPLYERPHELSGPFVDNESVE